MFWRRKSSNEAREPAATLGGMGGLAPVRILTADSTIEGWINLAGQRLSDVLNLEELLSVSRTPIASTPRDWFVTERDDMLLVVPPPHHSDRAVRLHRVKQRIRVVSGHYVVRGTVHLVAGIGLDAFLARSRQHFLPMTEARVTSTERPELDEEHPALLVNVRSTAQRLKLETLD